MSPASASSQHGPALTPPSSHRKRRRQRYTGLLPSDDFVFHLVRSLGAVGTSGALPASALVESTLALVLSHQLPPAALLPPLHSIIKDTRPSKKGAKGGSKGAGTTDRQPPVQLPGPDPEDRIRQSLRVLLTLVTRSQACRGALLAHLTETDGSIPSLLLRVSPPSSPTSSPKEGRPSLSAPSHPPQRTSRAHRDPGKDVSHSQRSGNRRTSTSKRRTERQLGFPLDDEGGGTMQQQSPVYQTRFEDKGYRVLNNGAKRSRIFIFGSAPQGAQATTHLPPQPAVAPHGKSEAEEQTTSCLQGATAPVAATGQIASKVLDFPLLLPALIHTLTRWLRSPAVVCLTLQILNILLWHVTCGANCEQGLRGFNGLIGALPRLLVHRMGIRCRVLALEALQHLLRDTGNLQCLSSVIRVAGNPTTLIEFIYSFLTNSSEAQMATDFEMLQLQGAAIRFMSFVAGLYGPRGNKLLVSKRTSLSSNSSRSHQDVDIPVVWRLLSVIDCQLQQMDAAERIGDERWGGDRRHQIRLVKEVFELLCLLLPSVAHQIQKVRGTAHLFLSTTTRLSQSRSIHPALRSLSGRALEIRNLVYPPDEFADEGGDEGDSRPSSPAI